MGARSSRFGSRALLAPVAGQTLVATPGTWTGSPTSFAYQWQDCNAGGDTCTPIAGATGSTYVVAATDAGYALAVIVAASNGQGSASQLSALSAVVAGLAFGSQGGPYRTELQQWPGASWTPFASNSPWNTQLPAFGSATLDANSANTVNFLGDYFLSGATQEFTSWTASNTASSDTSSNFGHPVYWAQPSDPTWTITDAGTGSFACSASSPGATSGQAASYCPATVQIPNGAQHALNAASDRHLAVVQPLGSSDCGSIATWCEVDLWKVQNPNPVQATSTTLTSGYSTGTATMPVTSTSTFPGDHQIVTVAGIGGNITCTGTDTASTLTGCSGGSGGPAASGAAVTLTNVVVHDYGALDFNGPGCCGGSTAANQGLSAGAVRGPEITAGTINHALSAVAKCDGGSFVAPSSGAGIACSGANLPSTTLSGGQSFPEATVTVAATTSFGASPPYRLTVAGVTGTVTCTGSNTATTLTTCSGGSGSAVNAAAVTTVNDAPNEGARIQLKMDDATINGLSNCSAAANCTAFEKTILKAMAHYGIYVTDTGGSPLDLQMDPTLGYSSFGSTASTVATALGGTTSFQIQLPWSDFQIASSCYAAGTC